MRALIFSAACTLAAPAFACSQDEVLITGDWGEAAFRVDVADDPEEQSRGLMFVESMGRFEGMIFVYEEPQSATFWMKNTLIPLDMIFVDSAGVIQSIHERAQPQDETTIFGGDEIAAVLEVNGGMVDILGIDTGDILQHPSFGPDAANPCEIP